MLHNGKLKCRSEKIRNRDVIKSIMREAKVKQIFSILPETRWSRRVKFFTKKFKKINIIF